MKELNSGAFAPPNAYVYTANFLAASPKVAALLIERLGRPGPGNLNRLILPMPLFEWADKQKQPLPHSNGDIETPDAEVHDADRT